MKKVLLVLIQVSLFSIAHFSQAYTYLSFSDPQSWNKNGIGTIEEAVLDVQPKGIYFQYDLYLTFSARGYNHTAADTLELSFYFDLPQNASITDSWLWVGDSAVQAGIYDIATARNTYEGIVKRRRDPSILYKRGNGNYELRIFPMKGNESRKVKISYLVPIEWKTNKVTSPLPINLLTASHHPVENFKINISKNAEWKNPLVFGSTLTKDALFNGDNNSLFVLNASDLKSFHSISFANPMKDGIYYSNYKEGNTGYFQMALSPSSVYKFHKHRKLLFIVDYDSACTEYSKNEALKNLQEACLSNMSIGDSINFLFKQNGKSSLLFNKWVIADPSKINDIFKTLDEKLEMKIDINNAVIKAVELAAKEKYEFSVVWLSSSIYVAKSADTLITYLKKASVEVPPFHIAKYSNKKILYYYGNNNEYSYYSYLYDYNGFFHELARLSSGSINQDYYQTENILSNLNTIFSNLEDSYSTMQVTNVLSDGFVYSAVSASGDDTPGMSSVYTVVGKYQGNFPLSVYFSAEVDTNVLFKQFNLIDRQSTDPTVKKMWASAYINRIEKYYPDKNDIEKIVAASISNRVLSMYTAFLALEPGMEVKPCEKDCEQPFVFRWFSNQMFLSSDVARPWPGPILGAESKSNNGNGTEIIAYPNPSSGQVTFSSPSISQKYSVVKIYNPQGTLVSTLSISAELQNQFTWNGQDDLGNPLSAGVYLAIFSGKAGSKTVKLMVK